MQYFLFFSPLLVATKGYGVDSVHVNSFFVVVMQEEIQIEGRALHVGNAVGVVSVELRKKKTGKIIAQGRHSKYLAVSSKM